MKRITIILALLVAMLPVLAHAQVDDRSITSADLGGSDSAQFGGVNSNGRLNIPVSGLRGNNLSDDLDAGVDVEIEPSPILACSGMDIRNSIKGMFDMSSLADDVKNYLLSLMAKQALSFVYSNPAIAGVLDGLKAFGNARFQLAQTSCEAIEGEVSAESRRLRQAAYKTCMKENNDDNFKCATETGSYTQGLNTFVNRQETKINNSIYNWTSRINYGGKDFDQRACENLNGYCNNPSARPQAEQINTAIPGVTATPGGAPKVDPPKVSPSEITDEAKDDARHAAAALMGVTRIMVSRLYRGNPQEYLVDYRRLQQERAAEINKDIVSNNGIYTVKAGRKYLNREAIENNFVLARSKATLDTANNLQRSMREDPSGRYGSFTVSEHIEMENGAGVHSEGSCHYDGSCFDVNCNGYSGGEGACVQEAGTRLPPGCRMNWETKPQGAGYTGTHGHVNCSGLGSNPDGSSGGLFASAIVVIKKVAKEVDDVIAEILSSGGTLTGEKRYQKFREIMANIPVSDKEVCFYDLDLKDDKGMEDIRKVTEIFALTAATNRIAQKMDGRTYDEGSNDNNPNGPRDAAAVSFVNSLPAKIQQLNLTIGRLALCYMVDKVDITNLVKTQYIDDNTAFSYITSVSQAVATHAAIAVYNGLIYQVQLAKIMANNSNDISPSIIDAFGTTISMLESMRDSIKDTRASEDNLSARLRSLDAYLARASAANAAAAAKDNSGKSFNAGGSF